MPILQKFDPSEFHPISYQRCLFSGKYATDNVSIADPHQGLFVAIDRMNMRRIMISKEHLDDDAIENRNDRHPRRIPLGYFIAGQATEEGADQHREQ